MSGEVEFGKCEICGKETTMERTYFRYRIKCECHSPYHFVLVIHCKDCIPEEPANTKIVIKTKDLVKIINNQQPAELPTDEGENNVIKKNIFLAGYKACESGCSWEKANNWVDITYPIPAKDQITDDKGIYFEDES